MMRPRSAIETCACVLLLSFAALVITAAACWLHAEICR